VRFALTSSPVFSRTDTVTDSETFYSSILDIFDDPEEQEEVKDLLSWWNRFGCSLDLLAHPLIAHPSQIFPNHAAPRRELAKNSALARIRAKRANLRAAI
jgi:hypothetical protein